jgi:phosphoesterase RecJ-like protein
MKIGKDKIDEFHITPSHAAGIVNVLSNIEDCEIHVHFAEDYDGRIRTEFRSKRIPVNLIASKYGGGGHALASGAVLNNWEEVDHVLRDLDELCKRGDM